MSLIAIGTAAAAGYGAYRLTGPGIEEGTPRARTSATLGGTRGQGRSYPIVGGALAWDPRIEEVEVDEGYFLTPEGRRIRLESAEAAFWCYRLVFHLGETLNKLGHLFSQSMTPEESARMTAPGFSEQPYDTSGLNPRQLELLSATLNCAVQWATSLRILSRIYNAIDFAPSMRPADAARARVDLRNLIFRGFWNPLAEHLSPTQTRDRRIFIRNPGEWEDLAGRYISLILVTYPDVVALSEQQQDRWVRDWGHSRQRMLEEGAIATTGAIPFVAIGIAIAVVLIGYEVADVLSKTAPAVLRWLGIYSDYAEELARAYEECNERCNDPDTPEDEREEICTRCARLGRELRDFEAEMPTLPRYVAVGGAILGAGALAYFGVRWYRKRKAAR